jgi:hypothetical protein
MRMMKLPYPYVVRSTHGRIESDYDNLLDMVSDGVFLGEIDLEPSSRLQD